MNPCLNCLQINKDGMTKISHVRASLDEHIKRATYQGGHVKGQAVTHE